MTYTADKPDLVPSAEELRARIPGWGADLDPADRPSVPRERFDPSATGAHWTFPERQREERPRERSIEHESLTPVFGTAQPLKGLSGAIRGYAYRRFSEGRAAHWLLLIAGDRVDVLESRVTALFSGKPDEIISETGIRAEITRHGLSSRLGSRRVDTHHSWMDPLIVAGPLVLTSVAAFALLRAATRR